MEKPEKIDEEFILKTVDQGIKSNPEVFFGWKMGVCLKYCVPPHRRYFDKTYCGSPRRRRDKQPAWSTEEIRQLVKAVKHLAGRLKVDLVGSASAEEFSGCGVNLSQFLPGAKGCIVFGILLSRRL